MSLVKKATKPGRGWKKGQSGNPAGKPKGTKDRRTIGRMRLEELANAMIAAEVERPLTDGIPLAKLMPLDYMLETLRHPDAYNKRDRQWAADKAAPYVHSRMPLKVIMGDDGAPPVPVKVVIEFKDARRTKKVD